MNRLFEMGGEFSFLQVELTLRPPHSISELRLSKLVVGFDIRDVKITARVSFETSSSHEELANEVRFWRWEGRKEREKVVSVRALYVWGRSDRRAGEIFTSISLMPDDASHGCIDVKISNRECSWERKREGKVEARFESP